MKPMILQEEHEDFADHEARIPVVFDEDEIEDGLEDYSGDPEGWGTITLTDKRNKPEQKIGVVKRRRKSRGNSPPSTTEKETHSPGKTFNMSRLSGKKGNKQWVHPPEALLRGHIVYNVKFLGFVEVDHPKGTDVVKEAVRKMKFNKQLKKAEGHKPPKVELTISVDGVTVQEPKHKITQHQYPLHRISYCADDKTDKKLLTFIAKEAETNKHYCYVFDSDKCAEEVTLTIGQAFDLAYRKFLDSSSKDMDNKKQFLLMQKKVQQLTEENLKLKERVADLERLLEPKVLEQFDRNKNNIKSSVTTPKQSDNPIVGRRLENLILEDRPVTNGTSTNNSTSGLYTSVERTHPTSPPPVSVQGTPILAPPPPVPSRSHHGTPATPQQRQSSVEVDLFGSTPFSATTPTVPSIPPRTAVQRTPSAPVPQKSIDQENDPFGMGSFTPNSNVKDLDQQILNVDKELMDLQTGFSQGISFGTDFTLADLDPLNQK